MSIYSMANQIDELLDEALNVLDPDDYKDLLDMVIAMCEERKEND